MARRVFGRRLGYITLFAGPEARRRARDYFEALNDGRLKIVRDGPPRL
jgi:hypothetical protein